MLGQGDEVGRGPWEAPQAQTLCHTPGPRGPCWPACVKARGGGEGGEHARVRV